ncbi:MAG: CHASE3 domain-containing protein [Bacteroidota bacterium]
MKNFSLERKIMVSFLIVSAAFALMLYAFYYSTRQVKATSEKVKQSQEAIRQSEQILSLSLDMTVNSREYLLTGDEQYLDLFDHTVTNVHAGIDKLYSLTSDNQVQQRRVDKLEQLTANRVAFAEKTIALKDARGTDAAIKMVNTSEGRHISDSTRQILRSISSEELKMLAGLEAESESSMNSFEKVLITLVAFIDIILILVGLMIFQNQKIRSRYEEQLQESNKELESFSYMVSHDLRSPVLAMLGFMRIVKKKYEPGFDEEQKEMFGHIKASAQRMNAIIEDLLALAKHGREKLRPVPVDMNELFKKVWSNMADSMPHSATLELGSLPVVETDISMMEQVVVNLCSNAIKYSSRNEKPVVTVGFSKEKDTTTYFVKDNGAGFDMKNYDRLFKAFQRLHHSNEYEGTGIGLLLVKRIIEMHRGKIWAESSPGEGATFYFSLPG